VGKEGGDFDHGGCHKTVVTWGEKGVIFAKTTGTLREERFYWGRPVGVERVKLKTDSKGSKRQEERGHVTG